MDLTASFTVAALRLTGIPVLREGMFFSIPSGDFEVAKACSGIRYLIACLALGVLFANIAYRGWRKRLIFIAASIAAPLLGNCVRAYLIVLIAHWSELRLAVGVDHLIYGWLFFGMLVFVMFWIGSRFQDEPVADQAAAGAPPGPTSPLPVRIGVGIAAVALVALGPWALARSPDPRAISLPPLVLPHAVADWQGPVARGETWQLDGFDRRAGGVYVSAAGSVALELLGCCAAPADVIGAFPALVDPSQWQTLQTRGSEVAAGARSLRISETILRSRSEERVVWRWYVVGGELIASDWRAKTVQTWLALRGRPEDSMLVVLSSAAPEAVSARQVLETFMRDNGERIVACFEMHHCVAAR
jgi:EpsI family protein